ncbi:MAG: hypothetical protein IT326_09070 [Anaerolineae bacterium]|nr:hypothetical protein [Anaerolineae bacterium]
MRNRNLMIAGAVVLQVVLLGLAYYAGYSVGRTVGLPPGMVGVPPGYVPVTLPAFPEDMTLPPGVPGGEAPPGFTFSDLPEDMQRPPDIAGIFARFEGDTMILNQGNNAITVVLTDDTAFLGNFGQPYDRTAIAEGDFISAYGILRSEYELVDATTVVVLPVLVTPEP